LHQASHYRSEEMPLVPEIEVDRPLGDPGLPGDIVDAGGFVTVCSEDFEGGGQDFLLAMQLLLPSARRGFGSFHSPGIHYPHYSLHKMTERSVIIPGEKDSPNETPCQLILPGLSLSDAQ